MAHRLGTVGVDKSADALPHIYSPVYATQENGKIAPHKLIWPAFWGDMKDGNVALISFETVREIAAKPFKAATMTATAVSSISDPPPTTGISETLKVLAEAGVVKGKAVRVNGGNLYSLSDSGALVTERDHPAAKPYMWPIAHGVRPAAQSLGIRYCTDCHATDAPFFFGKITVGYGASKEMVEFQDVDATYAKLFAMSFVFRPMLKIVSLCSCAVVGLVLLLYGLRALRCVVRVFCS